MKYTRLDIPSQLSILRSDLMIHAAASIIAVVCYLAAAIPQGLFLFNTGLHRGREHTKPGRGAFLSLCAIAVSAHAVSVFGLIITPAGIDLGIFRVMSLIAWFICLLTVVNALRRPVENSVVILFPISCVAIAVAEFTRGPDMYLLNPGAGMLSHILLSILAYSVLALCAVQALVLAVQERELKHHHLRGILRALPPLQTMEAMLFEGLWLGLGLLTLAIATGAIYVDNLLAQHLVHKTVFSVAAWIIFAALLWGHRAYGWRGHIAVRWTLIGFVVLVLAYVGTKLVLELILQRPGT
jgi:ABC-type uncharacterized transport system permease subunit